MAADDQVDVSAQEEAAETAPARPPWRARFWRQVRKYALVLPVGMLTLLALAVLGLDTSLGHRLLADVIAGLETDTGLSVTIGRIEGSIYGEAVLDNVALRDPQGVFLRVPAVQLAWRPWSGLDNQLDIRRLVLKRGVLLRAPHLRPGNPNAPLLPDFDVRVDRFAIEHLLIARRVLDPSAPEDAPAQIVDTTAPAPTSGAARMAGAVVERVRDAARDAARVVTTGKLAPKGKGGIGPEAKPARKPAPDAMAIRRVDLTARLDLRKTSAYLSVVSHLGGGDRLDGLLDVDRSRDRFQLNFDVAAPRDGLLAALAGERVERAAHLSGQGTWRDWHGTLAASQNGQKLADLALSHRAGQVALLGELRSAPLADADTRRLLGPVMRLSGKGEVTGRTVTGTLEASSATLRLSARGGVDAGRGGLNQVTVLAEMTDPAALDEDTWFDGLHGTAHLAGPFAALAGDLDLKAQALRSRDGTVVTGLALAGPLRRDGQAWTMPATLSAQRIVTGTDRFDMLADPHLTGAVARGQVTLAGGHLSGKALRLTAPGLTGDLALDGDFPSGEWSIKGEARAWDWALRQKSGADPTGSEWGRASAGLILDLGWGRGRPWALTGRLNGRIDGVAQPALRSLAGEGLTLNADLAAGKGQPLLVTRGQLHGERLDLSLTGRRAAKGGTELSGAGRHVQYGSFTFDAVLAEGAPRGTLVLADPYPAAGLKAVRLALAPIGDGFRIDLAGASMLGPFEGSLGLALPADAPVRLSVDNLTINQTHVTGALDINGAGAAGRLALNGGGVTGSLDLTPRQGGQGVNLALTLKGAHFGGDQPLFISSAALSASGLIAHDHTTLEGKVLAQGIGRGHLVIGRAAAQLAMADGRGRLVAQISGRRGSRFDLQALAEIVPDRISVGLQGQFAGQRISMPSRAVLTAEAPGTPLAPGTPGPGEVSGLSGGGWRLAPAEIDFGGGRAVASGLIGNGLGELRLALSDMPLSLGDVVFTDLGLGGKVSGLLTWGHAREGLPMGDMKLWLKGLTRSGVVLTSRPIDVALVGQLDGDTLQVKAVASEGGATRGRLQGMITGLPAQGLLIDRLGSGHLTAQMRYSGPADAPWRLMAIDAFDLTGPIDLAADIGGTIDNPEIRGSLASDALRLQSGLTGTDIQQASLRGSFDGARLVLSGMSGQTPGGGTVVGGGTVDFTGIARGHGPAMDLKLALRRAKLLARSDMALSASGPLRLVSDGKLGTIAGRLTVDDAHWRLGQATAQAELPAIPTRELNRALDVAPATARLMTWRFLVDAAGGGGRLRVQGLGLDSEWSPDIRLRGTPEDPALDGHADLLGGSYEFAGKRFTLTRGRITFDGSSPPDPRLDIVASADVSGLTASVTVRGSALRPEIAFSSVPALPEEELLARILFGTSVTKISAPEAVQLGSALAALHGGGGLDPINKLRGLIGLDRLRVVSADTTVGNQTGLAAGKYIGRRFYAEILSDGRGYSATNLEFRMTSWLSLLGSVSSIGRQSVNARVSKDY